jgi:nucleoside-diphosphate-sugar epimerase
VSPPSGRPERVLVTGAFGNIGQHATRELCAAGHHVRALRFGGVRTVAERDLSRAHGERLEVVQADVRDRAAMDAVLRDVDCVVHLAFLIPPPALERPAVAQSINVEGTRTVLAAACAAAAPPRLVFASTLDVYGATDHLPPPRSVGDPVQRTDAYSAHKIDCERLVAASGLAAVVLRYADVPPIAVRGPHPMMFRVPLAQRFEMIHPEDAGLATARAAMHPELWAAGVRTLNIGGGPRCQLLYRDYIGGFLEAMGVGMLPEEAFSTEPYCTDWLDTEESERLLRYQRKTFEDVVRETRALLGLRVPLARVLRPLVRAGMLSLSPHWRARAGRRPGSARA